MSHPPGIPNCSPANLLFSWEMARSTGKPSAGSPKGPQFSTPFGEFTGFVCLCGTLTDKEKQEGGGLSLRVSDPTGLCIVIVEDRDIRLIQETEALEEPCFIYVLGKLRNSIRNDRPPLIYAETVTEISRSTRNNWITETANNTIRRLSSSSNEELKKEFSALIAAALETAQPPKADARVHREYSDEEILEIVQSLYEGKAAGRAKVIKTLTEKGFSRTEAEERILTLMEQGDLYSPRPDILKVL